MPNEVQVPLKYLTRCTKLQWDRIHQALIGVLLIGWSPPGDRSRPLKTTYFNYFAGFWVYRALGEMLSIIVSNSDFGKRSGAGDMTICWSHVGAYVSKSVNS